MQSPTISSFQTQHFPLEPSGNAPREAKSVVSAASLQYVQGLQ